MRRVLRCVNIGVQFWRIFDIAAYYYFDIKAGSQGYIEGEGARISIGHC